MRRIDTLTVMGFSLREVARLSGVGRTTVANVATGKATRIWPGTLKKLLESTAAIAAPDSDMVIAA